MLFRLPATVFALALCISVAVHARESDAPAPVLAEAPWLQTQGMNLYSSGQPTKAQFQNLLEKGVQVVIDLRADDETPDFDEAAFVRGIGLQYLELPVRGKEGLTRENVLSLDALFLQAGERPLLLHCSSGNRVGAMMALREAWLHGATAEQALVVGRAWGMKSLEPDVTALLQGATQGAVAPAAVIKIAPAQTAGMRAETSN